MAFESITDAFIGALIECPKQIINPLSRTKIINGHEQINYKAVSKEGTEHKFEIYKRQNLREGMDNDFSCVIKWLAENGTSITLKRYNDSSHNHLNILEKEKLGYKNHIHIATEKYSRANRKTEGFAITTDRYTSLEDAFNCLITDCNISGINFN